MADVTISARTGNTELFNVVRGTVSIPRVGAWHADLTANGPTALAGAVDLAFGRTVTLKGTIVRARLHEGVLRARVVGGAGGLQKTGNPKHYTSPTVRNVLADLLADAGESLSAVADAGALRTTLLAWTTLRVSVGSMIASMLELAGDFAWRVQPDGTIWVGPETWPESDAEYRQIDRDPENALIVVGQNVPTLMPGTAIDGQRIDYVEHQIAPGEFRSKLWTTA